MVDPRPTFAYLVTQLAARHPALAYLHLIEPRVAGADDREALEDEVRRSMISVSTSLRELLVK